MKQVTIPAQWLQELIALCGPEDHELRVRVMKSAAPAPADALATATGLPAQAVASIYVTEDGQRECDDWKVPLPVGRNLLYAAPQAQADARDANGMYYLQDARHSAMVGNCPSWWRPDGNGYTTNLDEAARFTFDEAMAQHRCRDTDLPWLCSEVDKLRRPTVDCQYMPRSWDAQRESIAAIAAAKGK